jgi:hypothetical protein
MTSAHSTIALMNNPSERSIDQLEAEKIAARKRLLQQPLGEAQQQVNQVLQAESWQVKIDNPWIERIPRTNDPERLSDDPTAP